MMNAKLVKAPIATHATMTLGPWTDGFGISFQPGCVNISFMDMPREGNQRLTFNHMGNGVLTRLVRCLRTQRVYTYKSAKTQTTLE
jgi:hypothetical protein